MQKRRSPTVRALLIFGCLGAFAIRSLGAPNPKPSTACDQACLTGFMDQYLAALGKHDPSGLPAAASAKITENTKRVALGEGIWKTMKYMKFRGETISDPSNGEVVYFGVIQES